MYMNSTISFTRWFKYDRDKLWLVYTQSVPVIFEPPCTFYLKETVGNGMERSYMAQGTNERRALKHDYKRWDPKYMRNFLNKSATSSLSTSLLQGAKWSSSQNNAPDEDGTRFLRNVGNHSPNSPQTTWILVAVRSGSFRNPNVWGRHLYFSPHALCSRVNQKDGTDNTGEWELFLFVAVHATPGKFRLRLPHILTAVSHRFPFTSSEYP